MGEKNKEKRRTKYDEKDQRTIRIMKKTQGLYKYEEKD